jgi:hypothetical protein
MLGHFVQIPHRSECGSQPFFEPSFLSGKIIPSRSVEGGHAIDVKDSSQGLIGWDGRD